MNINAFPWTRFWSDQTLFDDAMLGRNVSVFLETSAPLMAFSRNDRVLDIGCGPGHLIAELAPKVGEIYGLDTSPTYVRACGQRFADFPNVTIGQLGDDYTDLSSAGDGKFDKIVCLSVIQYYRDKNDVRQLLAAVKNIAAPGARFLIADILIETTLARDILSLVRSAVRDGELAKVLKFLWRARFGEYAGLRRDVGLLSFREGELRRMVAEENIEAEVINKRLTVNDNRSNLMIRY